MTFMIILFIFFIILHFITICLSIVGIYEFAQVFIISKFKKPKNLESQNLEFRCFNSLDEIESLFDETAEADRISLNNAYQRHIKKDILEKVIVLILMLFISGICVKQTAHVLAKLDSKLFHVNK